MYHIIINRTVRATRGSILFFLAALFLLAALPCTAQDTGTPSGEIIEVVVIDGKKYQVPPPWTGHRIDAPYYTFESFKKIPVKFTQDNSSVYILAEAQPHLVALLSKAEEDGVEIRVESGYRSQNYQSGIFKRMISQGRTFDDIVRYVAPPGYSQHMLGIAVDFYPSNWRFADTPQYGWLQENAHLFSFEETYSQYNRFKMPWEAWHWSYTGN